MEKQVSFAVESDFSWHVKNMYNRTLAISSYGNIKVKSVISDNDIVYGGKKGNFYVIEYSVYLIS